MEERKLGMPETTTLSEQMYLRCVCSDLRNNRNFPASTRDEQAFYAFVKQTGLDFDWPIKSRLMVLNEALRHDRMHCDWNREIGRYLLTIVRVRE